MCQAVTPSVHDHELDQYGLTEELPKSPSEVHRSAKPPSTTSHDRLTTDDDRREELRPTDDYHRHRSRSRKRAGSSSKDRKEAVPTPKLEGEKDTFVKTKPSNEDPNESRSPPDKSVHPETDNTSCNSYLLNSLTATERRKLSTQQDLPPGLDELKHTLIKATEEEIRKSLLNTNDIYEAATLKTGAIDRLQDTLVNLQTIEKQVTTQQNDSDALKKSFDELKQAIVDTVVQQQFTVLQDLIKQTVSDALLHHSNSPAATSTTTATNEAAHSRKPTTIITNREVKITADLKRTRIDADFRQQRDAVVANKQLRDIVRQWSSMNSIADLVLEIRKHGTNNLECAWLLFCWIGQNIQYNPYCSNNAAETVFRTRQGVCRGFVSLYHECCSLLGIECTEISGYAKQAFLKRDEDLKRSPHAWNSIILDKYTYLIDPTWGANSGSNSKKLEDFYFLTSPEEFIYTHYVNGYQLLEPELSKEEFLSLPVMKATYNRLHLNLISPKQGLNETNQNLFKITIRTPEHVDLFAQLRVGGIEYPRNLHTFCQRDKDQSDVYNCYISPPLNGLYDVDIFAKMNNETMYSDAISMRLRVFDIADAFMFPIIYSDFTERHCILVEPFHRFVRKDQQISIHMIIPNANVIKIRNGDDYMVPCKSEYEKGVLKKEIRVQGDIQICGRWDDKADSISILCIFNVI